MNNQSPVYPGGGAVTFYEGQQRDKSWAAIPKKEEQPPRMHARHESRDVQRERGTLSHAASNESTLWIPMPSVQLSLAGTMCCYSSHGAIEAVGTSRQQGCPLLPSSAQDGTLIFESKKPKMPSSLPTHVSYNTSKALPVSRPPRSISSITSLKHVAMEEISS